MYTKNTQQTARATEIEARLQDIHKENLPLGQRANELVEEIEKIGLGISDRDWVLLGQRPRGAVFDGGHDATYKRRRELFAQRELHKRELAGIRKNQSELRREESELRNELNALLRAMVTPESLNVEITKAVELLTILNGERSRLSDQLNDALRKQAQIESDIEAEPAALNRLEHARADTYLAPNDDALAAVVDQAEANAVMARERAAGARAAADRVTSKVDVARHALAQHDAKCNQQAVKIQILKQQKDVLVARLAIHAASDELKGALADLLEADEREGMKLAQDWAENGLCLPGEDGDLRLAHWLRGILSCRTGVERRAVLLSSLAK